MTPTLPSRPFTVLDALALVAATAIGMTPGRSVWPKMVAHWPGLSSPAIGDYLSESVYLSLPCLAMLTLTLIALHLRRSAPSTAHPMQLPGTTDCLVASVFMALGGLVLAARVHQGLISFGRRFPTRPGPGVIPRGVALGPLDRHRGGCPGVLGHPDGGASLAAGAELDRLGGAGHGSCLDRGRVNRRLAQSSPS